MSGSRRRTLTDHVEIQKWAKDHDALPASVRGTTDDARVGVLTFNMSGGGADDPDLAPIEWDEWLQAFEDNWLALVIRDPEPGDDVSTSFRLVNRDTVDRD